MPQKRPDYSKFTQPNGTIQVLMFWASLMLHLVIGSNLGLFGRLDPIQVKPAGGTVRVVDLTPAEQTRVPEAAKSKPLPIAQTPVNPEPATRTPVNSANGGRAGASNFVPPRANRPQLPQPSSQIPQSPTVRQPNPPVPIPPTNKTSGKSDIPIVPRPPRPSEQDSGNAAVPDSGNSSTSGKTRRKGAQDGQSESSSKDITPDRTPEKPGKKDPDPEPDKPRETPPPDSKEKIVNDQPEERQKVQDAINRYIANGSNLIKIEVPRNLQENLSCKTYKKIDVTWPIKENGDLDLSTFGSDNFTREEILPDGKINRVQKAQVISVVKATHARLTPSQRKELLSQYKKDFENFAYYSFKIPVC